ncbi:hypothetical protein CEXT_539901 [Caerostris extrusa]|uniref:Uncharacterized protein n=1 Tax=Caerostris extrusa TaxID=172846 RepID=A0AAV4WI04_CAEEX|nr:hypothetical protein CEXT_539901 [Caerostris extrusa]
MTFIIKYLMFEFISSFKWHTSKKKTRTTNIVFKYRKSSSFFSEITHIVLSNKGMEKKYPQLNKPKRPRINQEKDESRENPADGDLLPPPPTESFDEDDRLRFPLSISSGVASHAQLMERLNLKEP